jgi:hypothetical protein
MVSWNQTPDQSRTCIASCDNRVKMAGLKEVALALLGDFKTSSNVSCNMRLISACSRRSMCNGGWGTTARGIHPYDRAQRWPGEGTTAALGGR